MLRRFHICIFAFLLTSSAFAEVVSRGKLLSGWIFGGFSFTNHAGSGLSGGVNGSTGMAFGFGLEYRLNNEISIELDLLDVWKTYESNSNGTLTKYNLAYLEMPFLLKYNPSPWFSLKLGPYLAAFIMEAEKEEAGTGTPNKGDFKNDFGITGGMWFGFQPAKRMAVGLDLRYDFGLNNILNNNLPAQSVSTRTVMTMLTLTFFLK